MQWGRLLVFGVGIAIVAVAAVFVAGLAVVATVGGLTLVTAGLWRMYRQVHRP